MHFIPSNSKKTNSASSVYRNQKTQDSPTQEGMVPLSSLLKRFLIYVKREMGGESGASPAFGHLPGEVLRSRKHERM